MEASHLHRPATSVLHVQEQQQSKPEQSTGPKLPAALIIVLAGLVMTLVWQNPSAVRSMHLGPAWPKLTVPTKDQWLKGELLWQCVEASGLGLQGRSEPCTTSAALEQVWCSVLKDPPTTALYPAAARPHMEHLHDDAPACRPFPSNRWAQSSATRGHGARSSTEGTGTRHALQAHLLCLKRRTRACGAGRSRPSPTLSPKPSTHNPKP